MAAVAATLRLGTVMLGVRDLPRAVGFYREVLGLPVRFDAGEFVFLDGGGVSVVLHRVADLGDPGDARARELVFHVEDVDAAHRDLSARGAAFRVAPRAVTGDQFAADFRDPDGNVLSIFGPRRA